MAARKGVKQYRFESISFHDRTGRIIKRTTKMDRAKRLLSEVKGYYEIKITAHAYSHDGRGRLSHHTARWSFNQAGQEWTGGYREPRTAQEIMTLIETSVADGDGNWVTA